MKQDIISLSRLILRCAQQVPTAHISGSAIYQLNLWTPAGAQKATVAVTSPAGSTCGAKQVPKAHSSGCVTCRLDLWSRSDTDWQQTEMHQLSVVFARKQRTNIAHIN